MSRIDYRVELPEWSHQLFTPSRYKVAVGGRGSSKSYTFARVLLSKARAQRKRVLCTREFQSSIKESVYRLLLDQIEQLGFRDFYDPLKTIIPGANGSEFIFEGLRNNINTIRSLEGVDIVWCEEADKISSNSWEVLIPTIRKPDSEIWISFNPEDENDPTYQRFIVNPPDDCKVIWVNWRDNPWFPEVLRKEKDYLARVDPDAYSHVWEGQCRKHSKAQVLNGKWVIDSFEPDPKYWDGPYYGADWGFANDPAALGKCWTYKNRLYIEEEFWEVGVDINDLPERFESVSGAKDHTVRADCSRPETISYMQKHGYPKLVAAPKWKGSVEDGAAFLRSFEKIIIHPRCKHTQQEARDWSYKVDKKTGDIMPELADGNDHMWDLFRYALSPMIRKGFFDGCDLS